ncbi:hypothetical protein [Stratiformator vulcanicus]|uniref:Uncharacterized protein n=1 Tax=Stratiformator vulcanicus TaxID=2527980 RepID=A0A517R2R9_9PLAN|nr:hypothetical protein [Stratiformator vulcanicus]QDT38143.1 hypothetical protein Pan189_25330 [Stratiformator vulcanicus]
MTKPTKQERKPCGRNQRRGYAALLIVAAVFASLALCGYVVESLWLRTAKQELKNTAEAASLAATRMLHTDDRLRADVDWTSIRERASYAAREVAFSSRVAGGSVPLDDRPNRDVRFLDDANRLSNVGDCSHAVVTARRTKSNGRPIPLIFGPFFGKFMLDMEAVAESQANHRLSGLAATRHIDIPAFPLAIRFADDDAIPTNDWTSAITQRRGNDEWSYDQESGTFQPGADGIPELQLSVAVASPDETTNAVAVDFSAGNPDDRPSGLSAEDLSEFGEELRFFPRDPRLDAVPIDTNLAELGNAIELGAGRIVFLYEGSQAASTGAIRLADFAAIRFVDLIAADDGSLRAIVQPTIVATPTAILAKRDSESSDLPAPNPYVCKIYLSY